MYLFRSTVLKTTSLFIVLFLICISVSTGNTRNIDDNEFKLVHATFTEKHPFLEVASIEVQFEDSYSTVYFITTSDGVGLWQVISKVILKRLPKYMQLACTGITGHKFMCEGVYLAGAALITFLAEDMFQKSGKIWNAKASGNIGVASLDAKSIDEARIGQRAFAVSASETNFPWGNAKIADYGWGDWRLNGNVQISYYVPYLISSVHQYTSSIDEKNGYISNLMYLSRPIDPRKINEVISGLQVRLDQQGRRYMLYARQDISMAFESKLRTMYRVPDEAIIAGGIDNTDEPWFSERVPFNKGLVFTDIGLFYRKNKTDIGFVEWQHIADEDSTIKWDDSSVVIRHTGSWTGSTWLKTLTVGVSVSGVQPAEAAKLIKIIADLH